MNTEKLWSDFAQQHQLSDHQLEQFQFFYEQVCKTNELFNVTAITQLKPALAYHFSDSLSLGKLVDLSEYTMLADIGTGAGFPAIPLKIKYPHLSFVLIEVTHKKVQFLQTLCRELKLEGMEFYSLDWRTFLRKTNYPIELFCARASLQPEELVRMFKPSSPYKNAELVYWAAQDWQPDEFVAPLVKKEEAYQVGSKKRKLIFFK